MSKLWNVNRTAEELGISVSKLRKMVIYEEIPVTRIGRRVLFDPAVIEKWLATRTKGGGEEWKA